MSSRLSQLNVRIPGDIHRRLVSLCRANRQPVERVVTELVRRFLDQHGLLAGEVTRSETDKIPGLTHPVRGDYAAES